MMRCPYEHVVENGADANEATWVRGVRAKTVNMLSAVLRDHICDRHE